MLRERRTLDLAELTTLRLGGPAERFIEVDDTRELVEVVTDVGSRQCLLVLGGGSNVVVADAGVDVPVVRVATRGVESSTRPLPPSVVWNSPWRQANRGTSSSRGAVAEGWSGIEALSGIPGRLARHRSRTSAPTVKRSLTRSPVSKSSIG